MEFAESTANTRAAEPTRAFDCEPAGSVLVVVVVRAGLQWNPTPVRGDGVRSPPAPRGARSGAENLEAVEHTGTRRRGGTRALRRGTSTSSRSNASGV